MEFKKQDTQSGAHLYVADNGLGYRRLDNGCYLAFWYKEGEAFKPIGSYKRYQNCIRHLKEWAKENMIGI